MPFSEPPPKGRKHVNPLPQLNVLKCVLSIRRTKTDKINIFFYEILSPAGLFSSRMAFAPEDDEKSRKMSVEGEAEAFLTFTEDLFQQQVRFAKLMPPTAISTLENLLSEVLTPDTVRQALESPRGTLKTLEEDLREEISSRLGYRATAYLKVERRGEEQLAPFIRRDGASGAAKEDGGGSPAEALSFLVPCAPYIDPVRGTPVASLQKGDMVLLRLPEDEQSPIREKMQRADPSFDGVVKGDVISVHKDRHGNFTLLVHLSDDFNGVVTLEGNSRIRTVEAVPQQLMLPGATSSVSGETKPVVALPPLASMSTGLYLLAFGAMAALFAMLYFIRNIR